MASASKHYKKKKDNPDEMLRNGTLAAAFQQNLLEKSLVLSVFSLSETRRRLSDQKLLTVSSALYTTYQKETKK